MRAIVRHWEGLKLPGGYVAEKERDFSPREVAKLFEAGYDVMLHHVCGGVWKKGEEEFDRPIIYLNTRGRSFDPR